MNILIYIGKRLLTIAFSMIVVIIITYCLMYAAPGNFFDIQRFQMSGTVGSFGSTVSQKDIEMLRKSFEQRYGVDQPLWKQIIVYLGNAVRFKFGPSFTNASMTIEELVAQKFPITLTLGLMSIGLALLIGIPLGIWAALKRNTWADYTATFFAMIGQTVPAYVMGVFLVMLFSIILHWLPTSGWDNWKSAILPVVTLALGPTAVIARLTRISLLDTLSQDYIRTAYAKGGTSQVVIIKHALRNSLIPVTTVLGPSLGNILAGTAIYIENQFRVPGIGRLFVEALGKRDYPLIITNAFILAFVIMFLNLIVDLIYAMLDPRIKLK